MFSRTCEYGIRATLHIADRSLQNERVSLKYIAETIDSPEAFTAKILQQLARVGIISSIKGPNGGFEIEAGKLETLVLAEIVRAIDGESIFIGCGLGLKVCDENRPCPVHNRFKLIRNELRSMLENTKVADMARSLNDGLSFLTA